MCTMRRVHDPLRQISTNCHRARVVENHCRDVHCVCCIWAQRMVHHFRINPAIHPGGNRSHSQSGIHGAKVVDTAVTPSISHNGSAHMPNAQSHRAPANASDWTFHCRHSMETQLKRPTENRLPHERKKNYEIEFGA